MRRIRIVSEAANLMSGLCDELVTVASRSLQHAEKSVSDRPYSCRVSLNKNTHPTPDGCSVYEQQREYGTAIALWLERESCTDHSSHIVRATHEVPSVFGVFRVQKILRSQSAGERTQNRELQREVDDIAWAFVRIW